MNYSEDQGEISYIPPEAYLFFPKIDNSRYPEVQRAIFDGNTQFTYYEQEMIDSFRSHCTKEKYVLKPLWTDNMILRFLYANGFKMSKTLTSVKEHTLWREVALPVKMDDELVQLLNSGIIYIHGRDQEFRPIVIFNVYLLDPKKFDVELLTRVMTFWFDYVIREWMLPGQIENWVFIADVKGMSVATLMLPSIRKLFGYLQDNFKCRLHKVFALNVPITLYAPWQVIKKFLDEVTVQKVQVCKGGLPTGILNTTNPEQVEIKFGGKAKNSIRYWPPIIPSNNYFVNPKDSAALVTHDEYMSLYRSGSLSNMRIDHSIIKRSFTTPIDFLPDYSSVNSKNNISSGPNPIAEVIVEVDPNLDESFNVDYIEYMNERTEHTQIDMVKREFKSSFFEDILLINEGWNKAS